MSKAIALVEKQKEYDLFLSFFKRTMLPKRLLGWYIWNGTVKGQVKGELICTEMQNSFSLLGFGPITGRRENMIAQVFKEGNTSFKSQKSMAE